MPIDTASKALYFLERARLHLMAAIYDGRMDDNRYDACVLLIRARWECEA